MVENQIIRRGITDSRVIESFRKIPRHEFVLMNTQGLLMPTIRCRSDRDKPYLSHISSL